MFVEVKGLNVHHLNIESGGPREVSPFACPIDGIQTVYEPYTLKYDGHLKEGTLIEASAHAYVCQDCHQGYLLRDVFEEIHGKWLEKEKALGFI